MHTHSKHLHPQRRRRIARNLSAHRKPLAPALKAPKVIVLLGVLCGHHDALLCWTKISVFERGDAPAPEHRGARRAVGRSSRGAWAMRVSGHATHRWPRDDSAENGKGAALIGEGLQLFPCNLDSLSENQLPSVSPDLSTSSLACYASNQRCPRTKSGAACAQELGFEI